MKTYLLIAAVAISSYDVWKSDLDLYAEGEKTAAVYPWGDAWAWTRCPGGGVWCPPFAQDHGPKPTPPSSIKLWHDSTNEKENPA